MRLKKINIEISRLFFFSQNLYSPKTRITESWDNRNTLSRYLIFDGLF